MQAQVLQPNFPIESSLDDWRVVLDISCHRIDVCFIPSVHISCLMHAHNMYHRSTMNWSSGSRSYLCLAAVESMTRTTSRMSEQLFGCFDDPEASRRNIIPSFLAWPRRCTTHEEVRILVIEVQTILLPLLALVTYILEAFVKRGVCLSLVPIVILSLLVHLLDDVADGDAVVNSAVERLWVIGNLLKMGLEVPVMVSYLDWLQEEAQYYKVRVSAGVSYGRLFSSKISPSFTHPTEAVNLFQQNDISYTAGVSYFISRNWGFTARYSRSVNFLFHPRNYKNDPVLGGLTALQGYFLTFQTCFEFWQFRAKYA